MVRVKKRFYVLIIMLMMIALVVCLFTVPFFNASYIEIEGTTREIGTIVSGIKENVRGESIFLANREDIEDIIEADPYLVYKGLSYKLPNTIKVKVEERESRYYVTHYNNYLYCTADGVVIDAQRNKMGDSTLVKGYKIKSFEIGEKLDISDTVQLQAVELMFSKFVETGFDKQLAQIDVSDVLHIQMKTKSGYSITFGSSTNVERKLEWLFAIVKQVDTIEKSSCVIDVSSPENPTYKIIK